MTLAGIELRYLVNDINKKIDGYYVSNIYGITKDSLLFKFHHPEKSDV
jgi:predicted ribosome quality control (RQC) complex YloA/Tae2 family protein